MKVVLDLCVIPLGVGPSVSKQVAECEKIIQASGLKYNLHAYGTNIEGEWDDVMTVVKKCHEHLHKLGVPRISSSIKVGTRTDKEGSIEQKIKAVEDLL